jgi:DNA-binding winged helix-turn-helix (wHTH) protein
MTPPQTAPQVLRFGLFEVDLAAGILRKECRRVSLQEQPFKILRMLLERRGQLVTREELHQALWPAGTFVELDQGLNTAVKKSRMALGDSAENPHLLETIPRRGYCFIAPVEAVVSSLESEQPKRRPVLLAVVISVAIAAFAVWFFGNRTRTGDAELEPAPLTSYPGLEFRPSFSPDGSQVVFQWRRQTEISPSSTSRLLAQTVSRA